MKLGVALLGVVLWGCGRADEPVPPASPDPLEGMTFPLRSVVAAALAEDRLAVDAAAPLSDEDQRMLEGLTTMVASDAKMLAVAREDVERLGASAWSRLADMAREATRPDEARAAAIDLIDANDPAGTGELTSLAIDAEPPWVRARAAWRLSTDGRESSVPSLVLRLKYEKDHEVVVWIAATLARHANLAGLEGLSAIANDGESTAQGTARSALGEILAQHGEAHGLGTVEELWSAWNEPAEARGFPTAERSAGYRRAIYAWIARFEEFQLRGVDDARFVLQRLDAEAARALGAALHDTDLYTRVHAAQCLQRMGHRGRPAGPELLQALASDELAPHAAIALGKVGYAAAEPLLRALLGWSDTEVGLRLACARALGLFPPSGNEPATVAALSLFLKNENAELAQAAAESLLQRRPQAFDAAERVIGFLDDARVDPGTSERVLTAWIRAGSDAEVKARWDELGAPSARIETRAETKARRAARAQLVRDEIERRRATARPAEPGE